MKNISDKKIKRFFQGFLILFFVIASFSFYKYFIAKDYYVRIEVPCDREKEICFIYDCEAQGDECIAGEEVYYYKILKKKASKIPLCDPVDPYCSANDCVAGMDCTIIECNPDIDSCSRY